LNICNNNANDTTAADCNPSPCVQATAGAIISGTQTGYFHNSYTWIQLGVPKGSTVTSVDGSFWDKSAACAAGTTAGMQIFDSANTTEITSTTLVPNTAATDTSGATHGNLGAKTIAAPFQPAATTVTLRFNLNPAVGAFATCNLNGDNFNLTISFIPPNSHQVIVAHAIINTRDGSVRAGDGLYFDFDKDSK
jgi:hypothetical protein